MSGLRVSTLPGFGLVVYGPAGFAGVVVVSLVWRFCAGLDVLGKLRFAVLFDNFIGRKRNVDGGVLAVR